MPSHHPTRAKKRVTPRRSNRASGPPDSRNQAEASETRPGKRPLLSPSQIVESQLSPSGEPVLGLFLHVAYMMVMHSFERMVGHGEITPSVIGIVAHLAHQPGMSQAELARLIGLERATIGLHVSRAIAGGYVRRQDAPHDARSYALYLTPRGVAILKKLRERIPEHERSVGARLTADERRQLRQLLDRLVYG
jgi:DNA-binding MarR family transcriptional regulator